jgi:hypothetical protein
MTTSTSMSAGMVSASVRRQFSRSLAPLYEGMTIETVAAEASRSRSHSTLSGGSAPGSMLAIATADPAMRRASWSSAGVIPSAAITASMLESTYGSSPPGPAPDGSKTTVLVTIPSRATEPVMSRIEGRAPYRHR